MMVRASTALVCFVVTALLTVSAVAAPRVTFFAHSEVAGDRVVLQDVARVEGVRDAETKQRIYNLDLGKSPRPFTRRTLSRPGVVSALKQAGLASVRVVFPRKVVIQRPGQRLSNTRLTQLFTDAVGSYVDSIVPQGVRASVGALQVRGQLELPQGDVSVVAASIGGELRDRMIFGVSVRVDGVEVARKQVSAQLELTGATCRLAADVPRGHILTMTDVTEVEGAMERGGIPCEMAVGKSIRSRSRRGTLIRQSGLEAPIVVHRKERVTIFYESGPLRVSVKGEAMKDGAEGEIVPVVNLDSRKVLRARVIGAGQVRVQ